MTAAEQSMVYEGEACGYDQGHRFPKKGYRQAMVCEAVRFICKSDVDDDPNAATFMMPLADWNRYRHHTYKDRREAELPYIRSADVITVEQTPAVKPTPARPPIYTEFELVSTGIHIVTRRDAAPQARHRVNSGSAGTRAVSARRAPLSRR